MKNSNVKGTYDVGYCKPPEHRQFAKGKSGNVHGRPKGSLNFATVLERALREKVVINKNGHRKVVTKLEVAIIQFVNKAASGDGHAMRYLCQLVVSGEERAVLVEPTTQFSDTDQKVMDNIFKRFQQTLKESGDDTDSE